MTTLTVSEHISAPRETVWQLVTEHDKWEERISGIKKVEVLDPPQDGIVGLRWKETREFFGKDAEETMWVTDASPGNWYETRAESHGAVYSTRISLADAQGGTTLTMRFTSQPVSMGAKLMSVLSFLFMGPVKKALEQDLADLKAIAERD